METLTKYLETTFGQKLNLRSATQPDLVGLPYFLTEIYQFNFAEILGKPVVFITKKDAEILSPDQYLKHCETINKVLKCVVIIVFPAIESYKRNRLVQKQLNFVVPGRQAFLPSLLTDLKDFGQTQKRRLEYLQPTAQLLVLFHLQKESLNGLNYKQIAEQLQTSYLNIARAIENLVALGLCQTSESKERKVELKGTKLEIWQQALPFLRNPVSKWYYAEGNLPKNIGFATEINALARYTNINGIIKPMYAIAANHFTELVSNGTINNPNNYHGDLYLEIWKYNPAVLAIASVVDPLSLYLLFKDNTDERIQIALDELLTHIKW